MLRRLHCDKVLHLRQRALQLPVDVGVDGKDDEHGDTAVDRDRYCVRFAFDDGQADRCGRVLKRRRAAKSASVAVAENLGPAVVRSFARRSARYPRNSADRGILLSCTTLRTRAKRYPRQGSRSWSVAGSWRTNVLYAPMAKAPSSAMRKLAMPGWTMPTARNRARRRALGDRIADAAVVAQ